MSITSRLTGLFGGRPERAAQAPRPVMVEHHVHGTETTSALRVVTDVSPARQVFIMLPHFDRVGPSETGGDILIRDLYAGQYRIRLDLGSGAKFEETFLIEAGKETRLDLTGILNSANARGLPVPEVPPVGFLQREKAQLCQFWAGHAEDAEQFYALFSEEAYYAIEDEELRDEMDLTTFATNQGERWYDHDFLEVGYFPEAAGNASSLKSMSWSEHWEAELLRRAKAAGVADLNCVVLMGVDRTARGTYYQIKNPADVDVPGVRLKYLGEIAFHSF